MTQKSFFCIVKLLLVFFAGIIEIQAQQSIAREWNEVLLNAIRNDFARPTVHARNLYHSSVLMYDAWALFDDVGETLFLGKKQGDFTCDFNGIRQPLDRDVARREIISYALLRLLSHRFANSPGGDEVLNTFSDLHQSNGYDFDFASVDYSNGSYAALGNYLGEQMIAFGMQDGANEALEYGNRFYQPMNLPLVLSEYRDVTNIDPNRWQPLSFDLFVDQSGNTVPVDIPPFLSPEWGAVVPFSLEDSSIVIKNNGFDSYLYKNVPEPPLLQSSMADGINDPYKWHFSMVAAWSAHLDPNDTTLIDISPASLGNLSISDYPNSFEEYKEFYDFQDGGDMGRGHSVNPKTNLPYMPQVVKRSDYARVLAEFWADGPDSETPPGHWFSILNYVSDHPEVSKKIEGQGLPLVNLEWDVKSYLALGGALHDAAIVTWGIKGYYDYVRPISAIRYMSGKGQSTDPSLESFDPEGIPLIPGLFEIIKESDDLAGTAGENIGKIKMKAWKGPDYIGNPITDTAGVGWILGTQWWPYQRGTFVTPPFAGYVSGHSTFSRAAAEVLTLLTGDAFFPGGIGTFDVEQNEFLVFERGPTESLTLEWATYYDASDQTSLSRIWGGIHPPIDDVPGRLIGAEVGKQAFKKAKELFDTRDSTDVQQSMTILHPIPFEQQININTTYTGDCEIRFYNLSGQLIQSESQSLSTSTYTIDASSLSSGLYILVLATSDDTIVHIQKVVKH